jgi:hypothetical protein
MPISIREVFGSWTVISDEIKKNNHGIRTTLCRCSCGLEKQVNIQHLTSGSSTKCRKCAAQWMKTDKHPSITHGMSRTLFYLRWHSMRDRCNNPKNKEYPNYGGRGIKVCERWDGSFENFRDDMYEGYDETLQIDRVDTNLGYSKENCRWVSPKANARNTRKGIYLTFGGKKRHINDWDDTINQEGLSLKDALKMLNVTPKHLLNLIASSRHKERYEDDLDI